MVAPPQPTLTPAEYLTWEAQQPLRFEYWDGHVVAMTGGTIPHNQIVECYRRNERDNWELVTTLSDVASLTMPDAV